MNVNYSPREWWNDYDEEDESDFELIESLNTHPYTGRPFNQWEFDVAYWLIAFGMAGNFSFGD